jgi:hypothetical protein
LQPLQRFVFVELCPQESHVSHVSAASPPLAPSAPSPSSLLIAAALFDCQPMLPRLVLLPCLPLLGSAALVLA